MKAHKGEQIVCDCPKPVGYFDRDVEDGASIVEADFAIYADLCALDDLDRRWVCQTCEATVAERVSEDDYRWQVKKGKGWLL